jgi:hypothetical protein
MLGMPGHFGCRPINVEQSCFARHDMNSILVINTGLRDLLDYLFSAFFRFIVS